MCSIIVINHYHKDFPLILAANRDEDYNRPTSGIQVLSENPFVMGGKDDLAGGTWLGVNDKSIFAAVTNQGNERNAKLLSRGSLVLDVLKKNSINEILDYVESIDPQRYNHFNLIFGNNEVVFAAYSYILHSVVIRELSHGINVIFNNNSFNGKDDRSSFIHKSLEDKNSDWLEYYKTIKRTLASTDPVIRKKFRKNDKGISGHGTHSSSILAFSKEGLARYKYYDRVAFLKAGKDKPEHRYVDYIDLYRKNVKQDIPAGGEVEDDEL